MKSLMKGVKKRLTSDSPQMQGITTSGAPAPAANPTAAAQPPNASHSANASASPADELSPTAMSISNSNASTTSAKGSPSASASSSPLLSLNSSSVNGIQTSAPASILNLPPPPPPPSAISSHVHDALADRHRQSRAVPRDVVVSNLPALRDSGVAARRALLQRKLRLCCYIFPFEESAVDSADEAKAKEAKRSTLLELVNYLTVFKPVFVDEELSSIFEMLQINLFRPLPLSSSEGSANTTYQYNPEEDEPMSESSWPHLQVIYEFLLRLVTSSETDSKLMDKYINKKFILSLLQLFSSEDPRERDYLKTILHRIYGNFMSLRPFIRRSINNIFYIYIYSNTQSPLPIEPLPRDPALPAPASASPIALKQHQCLAHHAGIAELLEILGSIINGFALPLKEQHKQFLVRVLLPLHKVKYISLFHPQLSYCVTQFLEKDAALASAVLLSMLKFWPVQCSKKELMFLNEIEEILDRVQAVHIASVHTLLFTKIGSCIASEHFQIAERAIYVLNNDVIVRFITQSREVLVPILARSLFSNTLTHFANATSSTEIASSINATNSPKTGAAAGAAKSPALGGLTPLNSESGSSLGSSAFGGVRKRQSSLDMSDVSTDSHSNCSEFIKFRQGHHWNNTIVELTLDIIKLLNEMDTPLMTRCLMQIKSEYDANTSAGRTNTSLQENESELKREAGWAQLMQRNKEWQEEGYRSNQNVEPSAAPSLGISTRSPLSNRRAMAGATGGSPLLPPVKAGHIGALPALSAASGLALPQGTIPLQAFRSQAHVAANASAASPSISAQASASEPRTATMTHSVSSHDSDVVMTSPLAASQAVAQPLSPFGLNSAKQRASLVSQPQPQPGGPGRVSLSSANSPSKSAPNNSTSVNMILTT